MRKVPYTNMPSRHEGRFFRDMTAREALWLTCFVVPAMGLLAVQWLLPVAVIMIAVGIAGAKTFKDGKGIDYPRDWLEGAGIKARDNEVYDFDVPPERRRSEVIPFRVDNFPEVLSTIYHRPSDTDTAVVKFTGWEHVNDEPFDRHMAEQRLIEVLKTVIAQIDTELTFSVQQSHRPHDAKVWATRLNEHFLVDLDEEDPVDRRLHNTYTALFRRVEDGSPLYSSHITLSVTRPKQWRNISKHPENFDVERELEHSPLMRAVTALVNGLYSVGYHGVEVVMGDEMQQFVFRGWNVLYLEQSKQGIKGVRLEDRPKSSSGIPFAWPLKIKIHPEHDLLETEGSYHRILLVDQHNIDKVLPGGLDELFMTHGLNRWVLVTTSATTVSTTLEYWMLAKRRDLKVAFNKQRFSGGMVEDERDRDARLADREKVDSLYRSRSRPIRWQTAIVISGTTPEMVDRVEASVQSVLRLLRIDTRVIKGRARMLRAFLKAMFGFRSRR